MRYAIIVLYNIGFICTMDTWDNVRYAEVHVYACMYMSG